MNTPEELPMPGTVAEILATVQHPFEDRAEVIEAMDQFVRAGWTATRLRRERSRLKRLGVKSGVGGSLWYRLLAANALVRSAEIHDHIEQLEQRASRKKVNLRNRIAN